jgi:hypothetical protein
LQLLERGHRLLDRRVWVDPVLIVEVDLVYPKPLERALARLADVGPVAPDAVK